jgi:hypothetical protein
MPRDHKIAKTRQDCEQRLFCELNSRFSYIVAGFSNAVAELGDLPAPRCVSERARVIATRMAAIARLHRALSVAPAIGDSLELYYRALCEAALFVAGRSDVSATVAVADVRLSPRRELRLGQLLCELVAGAIERCPANGTIAVNLRCYGSRLLECSVAPPVGEEIPPNNRTTVLDDLVQSLGGRQVAKVGSGCAACIQIPI